MNANQQFVIALLGGSTLALTAIGGFIVSLVTLFRQKSNHAESMTAQAQAVTDVKTQLDGVQDKMIAAAKEQGHSDEREHPTT